MPEDESIMVFGCPFSRFRVLPSGWPVHQRIEPAPLTRVPTGLPYCGPRSGSS
jgi:hypothetical protein